MSSAAPVSPGDTYGSLQYEYCRFAIDDTPGGSYTDYHKLLKPRGTFVQAAIGTSPVPVSNISLITGVCDKAEARTRTDRSQGV